MQHDEMKEKIIIKFSSEAYSAEAIMNAAYAFTDIAIVKIESLNSKKITVSLTAKNPENFLSSKLVDEFTVSVLDHQVQITINRKTQKIREMLIAQAFEPCDNLEEVITVVKP